MGDQLAILVGVALVSESMAALVGRLASWRGAGSMLAGDVFKSTE